MTSFPISPICCAFFNAKFHNAEFSSRIVNLTFTADIFFGCGGGDVV